MDVLIQSTKAGDHKILQRLCASVDDEVSKYVYEEEEEEEEVFCDMVSFTYYPSVFGIIDKTFVFGLQTNCENYTAAWNK